MRAIFILSLSAIFLISACASQPTNTEKSLTQPSMNSLIVTSLAFQHNQTIPRRYTCEGEDKSPPLSIAEAPEGTKSFALIVDDPDAPVGLWVHWLVWNISPDKTVIAEGETASGALQGLNDFRKTDYGGPCPPPGKPHRYFFKVFALDDMLDLPAGSSKDQLESAMQGHILAQGELIGLYQR